MLARFLKDMTTSQVLLITLGPWPFAILWFAWFCYWGVSASGAKRNDGVESRASVLSHTLPPLPYALVGIAWLPLLFGIGFARTLVKAGLGPASKGRALLHAVIGLAIAVAGSGWVFRSTLDPKRRADIYARAQKLIHDDAAYLYKWGLRGVWGVSNRIDYEAPRDEVDRMWTVTPRKK